MQTRRFDAGGVLTVPNRGPYTQADFLSSTRRSFRRFALKTLRTRDLVLLGMAVVLTTLGTSLGQTQGALKGKVLPVVSTSDVIGYITPCG